MARTTHHPADLTTPQWERTQFAYCYAWGHAWDPYDGSDWRPLMGRDGVVLRCLRCGTERRELYNLRGDLSTRQYAYPDGYRYGRGERPGRDDFRLMALSKLRANRQPPLKAVR